MNVPLKGEIHKDADGWSMYVDTGDGNYAHFNLQRGGKLGTDTYRDTMLGIGVDAMQLTLTDIGPASIRKIADMLREWADQI